MKLNTLYRGDCLEVMKSIPDKSIDLVLTDPPYFWVVSNDWDNQWKTREEFIDWLELCTKEWKRVLKDNGSLYVFWDDKIISYVQVMMDKYFKLENNLVWYKPNNMTIKGWAQFNCYAPCTERVLFYSNEIVNINGLCVFKARDYIRSNIEKIKGGISLKEINQILWTADNGGGVASACLSLEKSEPLMMTEEHFIRLFQNLYPVREYESLKAEYESLKRPFNPMDNFTDVWTFSMTTETEKWAGKHPTIKPLVIIRRMIETSTRPCSTVLDCFAWSGTTWVACIETWRNYILIEKDEDYCNIIEKRLKATTPPLFVM